MEADRGIGQAERAARLLAAAVLAGYLLPLVLYLSHVGRWDHDQAVVLHTLARWNLFGPGLPKQWNPLLCGGVSLAGDPQVPVLSLPALLTYVLGPVLALKAAVVLFLVAGFEGARRLGRLWFRDRATTILFGALFVGNGYFFSRIAVGHLPHLSHLLLPGLLWAVHAASDWIPRAALVRDRVLRGTLVVLGLALVHVWAVDGSPHFLLYCFPWLVVYAAVLSWQKRSVLPLWVVGGSAAWGLVCDAIYVLPVIAEQAASPTLREGTSSSPLGLLWHLLVPSWGSPVAAAWEAHEYVLYVGPAVGFLILLQRRRLREALGGPLGIRLLCLSIPAVLLGLGSGLLEYVLEYRVWNFQFQHSQLPRSQTICSSSLSSVILGFSPHSGQSGFRFNCTLRKSMLSALYVSSVPVRRSPSPSRYLMASVA